MIHSTTFTLSRGNTQFQKTMSNYLTPHCCCFQHNDQDITYSNSKMKLILFLVNEWIQKTFCCNQLFKDTSPKSIMNVKLHYVHRRCIFARLSNQLLFSIFTACSQLNCGSPQFNCVDSESGSFKLYQTSFCSKQQQY